MGRSGSPRLYLAIAAAVAGSLALGYLFLSSAGEGGRPPGAGPDRPAGPAPGEVPASGGRSPAPEPIAVHSFEPRSSGTGEGEPAEGGAVAGSVRVRVRWHGRDEAVPSLRVELFVRDPEAPLPWQALATDAEGVVLFRAVPAGEVDVSVPLNALSSRVRVLPGAEISVDLDMRPGLTLRGRVVGEGGGVVSGAEILVSARLSVMRMVAAGYSGADGRFEIPGSLGGQRVCATIAGCPPSTDAYVMPLPPELRERSEAQIHDVGDLVVSGHVPPLLGRILDHRGAPLCGVEVTLYQTPSPAVGPHRQRADTGDGGGFGFPSYYRTSGTLVARKPGFAPAIAALDLSPGAGPPLLLQMGSGGTVRGLVIGPDGTPFENALVGCAVFPPLSQFGINTRTDPEGRFELSRLPAGSNEIQANLGRGNRKIVTVECPEGSSEQIVFDFSGDPEIRGRLRFGAGVPAEGWTLSATAVDGTPDPNLGGTVSPSGEFLVSGCRAALYALMFRLEGAQGFAYRRLTGVKPGGPPLLIDVDRDWLPSASLRGRLGCGPDLKPSSCRLYLVPSIPGDTAARAAIPSDPDGSFFFKEVLPGRYVLCGAIDGEYLRLREFDVEGSMDVGLIALDDVGYAEFVLQGCTSDRPAVDVYTSKRTKFLLDPVQPEDGPARLPPGRYLACIVDGEQRSMLKEFAVLSGSVTRVPLSLDGKVRLDLSLEGIGTNCSRHYQYSIGRADGAVLVLGHFVAASCKGSIEVDLPGGEAAYHLRIWDMQGVAFAASFATDGSAGPLSVAASLVHL